MNEHWKSITHYLPEASGQDIADWQNACNDKEDRFVTATQIEPIGKRDDKGFQLYDVWIYWKLNPAFEKKIEINVKKMKEMM